MIAVVFELMGALNFCTAVIYWISDKSDFENWMFFMLSSAVMYIAGRSYK